MRFRFSDCVLDAERFELSRAGRPVAVQPKVLELLLFLVRNHERAVTKEELLDAVWPDTATGESSLTRAVSLARTALGEREKDARVIRTVRGRGYRIGVPVRVDGDEAASAADDFVCRERELALAREMLALACAGHGQLLVVTGEPGIGKTRLAAELLRIAEQRGARAWAGRCHEGEGARSYGPWLELLRPLLAEEGADALLAELGDLASELAALVPELRQELPELPPPANEPALARARLFDAVAALLARCSASSPLALLLDDLHCADEPSLALLRFIAARLGGLPALVVVTYRASPPSDAAFAHALAELARFPARRELRLGGLDAGCVEQLIARVTGAEPSAAFVEACRARSEGNPFFLLELLRSRERGEELPDGIRHVVRRRLGALSVECRRVLGAAAILGREFPVALLARIAELGEGDALARLEEAELARVVEPVRANPGRFRFAHGLIAESLAEDLTSATRARLHLRAGLALEELYRPRPLARTDLAVAIRGEHLAELAHHFYEAQPLADAALALDYCERAGEHALSLLAFAEAARQFERALSLLESIAPLDAGRRERLSAKGADARARAG